MMGEEMASPNWLALPSELVLSIATKLSVVDLMAFCGVCKAWRSIAKGTINEYMALQLPLLMLHTVEDPHGHDILLDSLSEMRLYRSELYNMSCEHPVGFSHGFLMLVDWPDCKHLRLVNPFTRVEITSFSPAPLHYVITCTTLTAPPSSPDCLLLAFSSSFNNLFLYCHLGMVEGDAKWEVALRDNASGDFNEDGHIVKAIHFNEKVYAVTDRENTVVIELLPYPKVVAVQPKQENILQPNTANPFCRADLVESRDMSELLLIYVIRYGEDWKLKIVAFRLDPSTDSWVKAETLGDWTVFLTDNWLGAATGMWKGRENCICYVESGGPSLSIFSLTPNDDDVLSYPSLPLDRHGRIAEWLWAFWIAPHQCFA